MKITALVLMIIPVIPGLTYGMNETKQALREHYERKDDMIRSASENGGNKNPDQKPKPKPDNKLHKPACSPMV